MSCSRGSLAHQLFLEHSSAKVDFFFLPVDPLGSSTASEVSKVWIDTHVSVTNLRGR